MLSAELTDSADDTIHATPPAMGNRSRRDNPCTVHTCLVVACLLVDIVILVVSIITIATWREALGVSFWLTAVALPFLIWSSMVAVYFVF